MEGSVIWAENGKMKQEELIGSYMKQNVPAAARQTSERGESAAEGAFRYGSGTGLLKVSR